MSLAYGVVPFLTNDEIVQYCNNLSDAIALAKSYNDWAFVVAGDPLTTNYLFVNAYYNGSEKSLSEIAEECTESNFDVIVMDIVTNQEIISGSFEGIDNARDFSNTVITVLQNTKYKNDYTVKMFHSLLGIDIYASN